MSVIRRRGARRARLLVRASASSVLLAAALCAGAAEPAGLVVTSIDVVPEGQHLIKVTVRANSPIEAFSLSRQGPPEKRDLVLRVLGASSALSVPPTDVSGAESRLPFTVALEEDAGRPVVRIVLERVGDALVRMDHEAGGLALVLIPPESRRTLAADAYRIGADDVLAITVFGHDDLTKTTKVGPDGLVNFPLIGNVRASGRTVDDVSGEIQDRLGKDFLVEPHVTVSVWEYLSQWVNVIGEVSKPGRYYLTGPTTLIDAISQAGGLKSTAGDTILVTRRPMESDPSNAGEVHHVSAASLMSDEKSASVFRLRSGDVVNVLAHQVVYVSGEVRSPGTYTLDRAASLLQAITIAGGFGPGADTSVVEVVREDESGPRRQAFRIRDIEERRIADPQLRPGDVVVVKPRS